MPNCDVETAYRLPEASILAMNCIKRTYEIVE